MLTSKKAITWTLTSVTLLSLVLRVTIRLRRFRKLFWDDFSVGLAFVLSLATAIEPTFTAVHYDFGDDPGIKQGKVVVILSIMYNTCLWAVKIAFLLFFKRLGVDTIRNLRVYWWLVLVTTVLSYGALYTMSQERCIWTHGLAKPDCSLELKARRLGYTAVKVACALDVGTDLLSRSSHPKDKIPLIQIFCSHVDTFLHSVPYTPIHAPASNPFRSFLANFHHHRCRYCSRCSKPT